jgi:hypothetical protein
MCVCVWRNRNNNNNNNNNSNGNNNKPIPVGEWSKARVYGRSLAGIASSNPAGGMDVCCECCQVEVSATDWSHVQRSPTDCGASLCVISKRPEWGGSNS